jgi:hypothetical protein
MPPCGTPPAAPATHKTSSRVSICTARVSTGKAAVVRLDFYSCCQCRQVGLHQEQEGILSCSTACPLLVTVLPCTYRRGAGCTAVAHPG